jgi:hypothetical protein
VEIELVKQKHKKGCGIACLAMATNQSYDDVVKNFINDFDNDGMTSELVTEYLGDLGYSVIQKGIIYYNHKDSLKDEIIKPFAPVHIVSIKLKIDSTWHFVVMDINGKFFCPGEICHDDIRDAYYIQEVIGIYPSNY